jgi:hypothetical protein
MSVITLYKTNSDLVCAQKDDGPIWEFGPVTPDMYGEFAEVAEAWHDGTWEPHENDGQHPAANYEGLVAVATWDSEELRIAYALGRGAEYLGGAAHLWISGSADPVIPVTELYVRCSYPMCPDVIAASDTCQHPANTAVQDAEGNLWWRCPTHEGALRLGVSGAVVTHVTRPAGT